MLKRTLLLPGMQIGDYSIIEKIGSGGFGTVYSVESNIDSSKYALKILQKTGKCPISAIHREVEISMIISNEYCLNKTKPAEFAQIFDIGETDNFIYYVSELLGPSLDSLINKQHEDINHQSINFHIKILKYGKEMLLCLKKLHAMHVIHCDVKPENFLFRNGNEISLIDFGLSKIVKNYKSDQKGSIQSFISIFRKLFQTKSNVHKNLYQDIDLSQVVKSSFIQIEKEIKSCKKKINLFLLSKGLTYSSINNENQDNKSCYQCNQKEKKPHFKGTYKYASSNTLSGGVIGPRDDLISWFYSILELYSGSRILPWESLTHEIMAHHHNQLSDSCFNSDSKSSYHLDNSETPLVQMKKMKEYFEGDINTITKNYNFDTKGYILPEQLCEILHMPIEMAAAFRCILALKPGETFYHDDCYDEILFYIDSAIQSLEAIQKRENENIDNLNTEALMENTVTI